MSNDNIKKQAIEYALDQLKKTFDDIQKGKAPKPAKDLKKLQKILTEVDNKVKSNILTEEEANKIAQEIIGKVINKGK